MIIRTADDGSVIITDENGGTITILDGQIHINGSAVHIGDGETQDLILSAKGIVFTKFHAADPQNWEGPPPAWEWDALNRLASALASLGRRP